jgi:glutaredoxin
MGEPRNGDIQTILKGLSGSGTVPQVFIAGTYVGGGDDMARKLSDGSLLADLKAAGAEGV